MSSSSTTIKETYKFKKAESIVHNSSDEYLLSKNEYYMIYSFFVTYSMCGTQSGKRRTLVDYGWSCESLKKSGAKLDLERILKLDNNKNFCFNENDDLSALFKKHDLPDGVLQNLDTERAVLTHTQGDNKYFKLFYRIRDGLAHGSFSLRYNTQQEKMVIIQDQTSSNVTARIVIKLDTLLQMIHAIDKSHLIVKDEFYNSEGKEVA